MNTQVSASGSLSAVTNQNLGFSKAAKLIELDVKVGDTVKPGQILAKEDPFSFNVALNQARATLAQQQANLNKILNNVDVPNARAVLEQSKRTLDATRRNVDAQDDLNESATHSAKQALEFAEYSLDQAKKKARSDCEAARRASSMPAGLPGLGGALSGAGSGSSAPAMPPTQQQLQATCNASKQSAATAYGSYLTAKANYQKAKHQEDVGHASGVISIRQAQATVIQNQNTLDSARTDRPSNIAAQRAAVANQVAAVAQAQHDVDNTVLYAPVGGQVSAITGAVGEYLPGSSSGTTAQAPPAKVAPTRSASSPSPGTALRSAVRRPA